MSNCVTSSKRSGVRTLGPTRACWPLEHRYRCYSPDQHNSRPPRLEPSSPPRERHHSRSSLSRPGYSPERHYSRTSRPECSPPPQDHWDPHYVPRCPSYLIDLCRSRQSSLAPKHMTSRVHSPRQQGLYPPQPAPRLARVKETPAPVVEPQSAADMGPVLVAIAELSSPPSGADAQVPEVQLSATLEPSAAKTPPALPQKTLTAPGPEPKPAVNLSPSPWMKPQPAAIAEVKYSPDVGASPVTDWWHLPVPGLVSLLVPTASTVIVPARGSCYLQTSPQGTCQTSPRVTHPKSPLMSSSFPSR
ncbi:vegetative cell wall protein gp1 [Salmo salar]|uniref:Vegetative cell wall protein gp1 n=1 Tax=Salmo salar TaxID=8030 RepID=A0A1S3P046_SALSA|nr:vegetative cell wall protein gp1 [Salmo salar]|eukprot:XP_014021008.1 PREDICTED: vegetative cell wall protein gp1-like [Salmo salar]